MSHMWLRPRDEMTFARGRSDSLEIRLPIHADIVNFVSF